MRVRYGRPCACRRSRLAERSQGPVCQGLAVGQPACRSKGLDGRGATADHARVCPGAATTFGLTLNRRAYRNVASAGTKVQSPSKSTTTLAHPAAEAAKAVVLSRLPTLNCRRYTNHRLLASVTSLCRAPM